MSLATISSDYVPLIQTGIMIAGLFSILLVKRQISENTHWNRVNAAYTLLHTSNLDELENKMIEALKAINISLNNNDEIPDSDVLKIFDDSTAYIATMGYLNHVERICAGVAYKAFDEALLYAFYSDVFILTQTQFNNFIRKYRHDHHDDDEFFIELDKLTFRWKNQAKNRKEYGQYMVNIIKKGLGISPNN